LRIIVAVERISWLEVLNTIRQRLILRLSQKIQNGCVRGILLWRPMGRISTFGLNYQRTSWARKRKRNTFDEESVDDVHMIIFHGCDERS